MKKGIQLTFLAITINLIVAAFLIVLMFGNFKDLIDLISDWPLNLGVGILALYISGFFIGNKMEFLIDVKNWNSIIVGIIGLLTILLIGTLFGSTIGFLQEGLENIDRENGIKNAIIDYYFKPFFWIMFMGIIPTIVAGSLLGYGIKKNVLQHGV